MTGIPGIAVGTTGAVAIGVGTVTSAATALTVATVTMTTLIESGATTGATFGTFFGPVGTIVGGAVGGLTGGIISFFAGVGVASVVGQEIHDPDQLGVSGLSLSNDIDF